MRLFGGDSESLILRAKSDPKAREKLIKQNESVILRTASKTCMKYVSKSDDEWSVALCAFSKAIDSYEKERGDFAGFAATLIRRDLIDYHRHEQTHSPELTVSPAVFDEGDEEEESAVTYAVIRSSMSASDSRPGEEIAALSAVLAEFGFGFMDLVECSPKQDRTRGECLKAASHLATEHTLYDRMLHSHQLPASELTKQTGVSVKILDKYRKYIIASAIILSDEYPYLAGYLKPLEGRQQT